ncbi:hypothetical protein [Polaromonas sp.]|uniref:hypothetical protein n=1 Tax=Polaromonas sp. TaxID=1869339 RepID=UPI0037503D62
MRAATPTDFAEPGEGPSAPFAPPGGKPGYNPAELPVEPDLGPVPPLAHPEDPGMVQPPI